MTLVSWTLAVFKRVFDNKVWNFPFSISLEVQVYTCIHLWPPCTTDLQESHCDSLITVLTWLLSMFVGWFMWSLGWYIKRLKMHQKQINHICMLFGGIKIVSGDNDIWPLADKVYNKNKQQNRESGTSFTLVLTNIFSSFAKSFVKKT